MDRKSITYKVYYLKLIIRQIIVNQSNVTERLCDGIDGENGKKSIQPLYISSGVGKVIFPLINNYMCR